MVCQVPRTYIPVPDLTGGSDITIPLNITDPVVLKNVLQQIVDQNNGPVSHITPPAVQNFVATTKGGGTLLTWDFNRNGDYYILYRSATGNLSTAFAVGIVPEGITARGQFMDPCGQETSGTLIYYWIQSYSPDGTPGPYTMTTKACVDCAVSTPSINPGFDHDFVFQDNFNRADGGANVGQPIWSPPAATNNLNIASNVLSFGVAPGSNTGGICTGFPTTATKQSVQVDLSATGGSGNPTFRMFLLWSGGTPGNGYCVEVWRAGVGTGLRLDRYNGSGRTQLAVGTLSALASIKLTAVVTGSSVALIVYQAGATIYTFTDSSASAVLSGRTGLLGGTEDGANTIQCDNFITTATL